jgi:cytochrome b561
MKGRVGGLAAEDAKYSDVAIALHWLLAISLAASFCVGLYMTGLRLSPTRIRLFNWHKWAGISILALSAFRLGWRWTHRPPAEPASMGRLQRHVAQWTHRLLYVLFFLVPLAGWCYSSAAGFPVVWLGILPLPDLMPVDKALAAFLKELHSVLAFVLAGLAGLHVAGALEHHFIEHDSVLLRMMPARPRGGAAQGGDDRAAGAGR